MREERMPFERDISPGQQYPVFCLCVDLIGSTVTALRLNSRQRAAFFCSLIDCFLEYLKGFGLHSRGAAVKFTGDGWLVMCVGLTVPQVLVAFAKTLCKRLQADISEQLSELGVKGVPGIRATIFHGHDVAVSVPFSADEELSLLDWVGDSARLACRYNAYVNENELLVDYAVFQQVKYDFNCEPFKPDLSKGKVPEEVVPCYLVGEIRPEIMEGAADADGSEYYALYLKFVGMDREATKVARQSAQGMSFQATGGAVRVSGPLRGRQARLSARRMGAGSAENGSQIYTREKLLTLLLATEPGEARQQVVSALGGIGTGLSLEDYNALMSRSPRYQAAASWYAELLNSDLAPGLATYRVLMGKAPDHDSAFRWYREMVHRGISPDADVYNALVARAPDYSTALRWYQEMLKTGAVPSAATYNALGNRAPDRETAHEWYKKVVDEGAVPGGDWNDA